MKSLCENIAVRQAKSCAVGVIQRNGFWRACGKNWRKPKLDSLSYDQFLSSFGAPDEIAAQLMEAVDSEEAAHEAKRRKIASFTLSLLLSLAIILEVNKVEHPATTKTKIEMIVNILYFIA